MKHFVVFVSGLLFGLGLTISQMVNPQKVLGFLDILGNWDPSLAFVMGGALIVTGIGYRLIWRQPKPVFAEAHPELKSSGIDRPLILGALLFGIGWGLVGLCPGPAISALVIGGVPAFVFVAAMLSGMVLESRMSKRI